MTTDYKIVQWIFQHLDELEWYEGATGGSVTRCKNVTIQASMAGLSASDGLKTCKILTKEVKKLMDTEDYTKKEIHEMILAIRKRAVDQIINRIDNPGETERVKRELFNRLRDGGY